MPKTKRIKTRSLYFTERISKAMNGIFDYPLTIVEAPMGYGKTTAVRECLKGDEAHVLWLKVYDSSPESFWHGFCRLFRDIDDDRSQRLFKLGFPDDGLLAREVLSLIRDINLTDKTVLVIDDYHLIGSSEVNHLIIRLAEDEIDNLSIVITARFTRFENLEEFALKGYLHYVTKEFFEFNTEGIINYYKLCGIRLKDSEADKLYDLTEGWISALYLLMLKFVEEGSFTFLSTYKLIEKAIYAAYPEEVKNFLLTMCIFDSFTLEQASHMWPKENTGELLTEVSSRNAFVKYDEGTRTYHIHSIFLNFLKDTLESRSDNIKPELYERAATWFSKTGQYQLAMHYFYLNKDFDRLFLAFEQEKATDKNFELNKKLLIKYIVECPGEIKAKHHFAVLYMAFRLYSYNEMDLFRKTCGEFLQSLRADKSINEKLRNHLLGEYEMVMSFTAYNDIFKMAEYHKNARRMLKEPSLFIRFNAIWTFGSPSILYMFYREPGKLEEHIDGLAEDLPRYSQLTNGNAAGAESLIRAEGYFVRGDLENAEILLHQGLLKAQSKEQMANILCARFLEARIDLCRGNFNISKALQTMREEITSAGEYLLIHTVEICEGYLSSLLKQSQNIPQWLGTGDFSSNRILFPLRGMLNIVYGRALLIKGEYSKLIGCSEYFRGIASVFPNLLGHIYTDIYLAAANKQLYRQKEALQALEKALAIAMPDRVYMPFVENCDYIAPLLEELSRQGVYREDINKVLEIYRHYNTAIEQTLNENFVKETPKLTEREIEIAQLAAQGLTNKEIGERLYISANTVKMALKNIYSKLSINNRALLKQQFYS